MKLYIAVLNKLYNTFVSLQDPSGPFSKSIGVLPRDKNR